MEPRFFKRGNHFRFRTHGEIDEELQWNHVFSNVEIGSRNAWWWSWNSASMEPRFFKRGNRRRFVRVTRTRFPASMEPRFFKRGNSASSVSPCGDCECFNGTTFFQTWKSEVVPEFVADVGISFNGTTFFQTWKSGPKRSPTARRCCFNGTTFFQTWKSSFALIKFCACPVASMEPRFFKRGNSPFKLLMGSVHERFNGTTFFQTWKCHDRRATGPLAYTRFNGTTFFQTWKFVSVFSRFSASVRFNGTTFFQTWKLSQLTIGKLLIFLLQWNHVFSNVEMRPNPKPP